MSFLILSFFMYSKGLLFFCSFPPSPPPCCDRPRVHLANRARVCSVEKEMECGCQLRGGGYWVGKGIPESCHQRGRALLQHHLPHPLVLATPMVTAASVLGKHDQWFASYGSECVRGPAMDRSQRALQSMMWLGGEGCAHLAKHEGNSIHTRVYIRVNKKKNRPDTGVAGL